MLTSKNRLSDLGLDPATAVTIFLKQTLCEQGIQFKFSREQPNAETVAAMDEYCEMKERPEKLIR